jgi:hypothetical protein
MTRLPAAVLQQHQRPVRVTPCIPRYPDSADAGPEVHRLGCARKPGACAHYGLNAQAPGPPGLPQLWQDAGSSAWADAVPVIAANVESFLRSSVPWQTGHSGSLDELRTRISNSFAQDAH